MKKTIILAALFVLHWVIVTVLCSYVFIVRSREHPLLDKLYLAFVAGMVISWYVFGACPISVIEKRMLGIPVKSRVFKNPSLQLYMPRNLGYASYMSVINALYIYNTAVVMHRLGWPSWLTVLVGLAFFAILIGDRIDDFRRAR